MPGGAQYSSEHKKTAAVALTISLGAVTVTQEQHTIDTEAAAGIDDLDTLTKTNADAGDELLLSLVAAARDVVLTNTGNIRTPGGKPILLGTASDFARLRFNGTNWIVTAFSTVVDSPLRSNSVQAAVSNNLDNPAVETAFSGGAGSTYTIPGAATTVGSLAVGSKIKIKTSGRRVGAVAAADASTYRVRAGAINLVVSAGSDTADDRMMAEAEISIRTLGAPGTSLCNAECKIVPNAGGAIALLGDITALQSTPALGTNANIVIDVTLTRTADGANSHRLESLTVEIV